MENINKYKSITIVTGLTLIICILISFTSTEAILSDNFYFQETVNWKVQSIGQDYIDVLLVLPILIAANILMIMKKKAGNIIWGGAMIYLVYTYVIYCFDVHFNKFFVEYCLILGLAFYSILFFFNSNLLHSLKRYTYNPTISKVTGIFFISISLLFYILWLAEIVPAINTNTLPKSIKELGAFTNPVHVLDLSIFLPGIFITGVLLVLKKPIANIIAPMILAFFIIMDITIAYLALAMNYKGVGSNITVSYIMFSFAMISIILFWFNLKTIKNRNHA